MPAAGAPGFGRRTGHGPGPFACAAEQGIVRAMSSIRAHRELISTTDDLQRICRRLASEEETVMVDTEFMRERSYYSQLCLVQLGGSTDAWAVDPLAEGLDLEPLRELLLDAPVTKVFHAARQDIEIFVNLWGEAPRPLFDTQIGAMFCGFGEQVGYTALAQHFAGAQIDKGAQFTDWARRPLRDRQIDYALQDVTHLRVVHEGLHQRLEERGRLDWCAQETAMLQDPGLYRTEPEDAWQRLKVRSRNKQYLAVMKCLAVWRESEAQSSNLPRNHVLRDEAIQEIAAERPDDAEGLERLRSISRGYGRSRHGRAILEQVQRGLSLPADEIPRPPNGRAGPRAPGPLVDLLKVVLKLQAERHDIAPSLIATSGDVERLAAEEAPDIACLSGWRREVYGDIAGAVKQGRYALAAKKNKVSLVDLNAAQTPAGDDT